MQLLFFFIFFGFSFCAVFVVVVLSGTFKVSTTAANPTDPVLRIIGSGHHHHHLRCGSPPRHHRGHPLGQRFVSDSSSSSSSFVRVRYCVCVGKSILRQFSLVVFSSILSFWKLQFQQLPHQHRTCTHPSQLALEHYFLLLLLCTSCAASAATN